MALPPISSTMQAAIDAVTGKRPKTVIDFIKQKGYCTTHDLLEVGYTHPPRAIADVKELGIPLVKTMTNHPTSGHMASYTLGDDKDLKPSRAGRRALPKKLKAAVLAIQGERCALCGAPFPANALQVDHRVPYVVGGDPTPPFVARDFMAICGSCNRSKSWSCEQCPNWNVAQDPAVCQACYWGTPEEYTHIATEQQRRVTLNWSGSQDVDEYDALATDAHNSGAEVDVYIKGIIEQRHLLP